MSKLTRRKPFAWIVVDLIATLILLGGLLKTFKMEIPVISDLVRDFPANLLIITGAILMLGSFVMFILPVIKANRANNTEASSSAIERSKR